MSQEHPFIQTIKKYYHGCSTADVELMKSTFTADVVHYFTDHAPIRGAASLAAYCARCSRAFRRRGYVTMRLSKGTNASSNGP